MEKTALNKPRVQTAFWKPWRRWITLKCQNMDWIRMAQDTVRQQILESAVMNLRIAQKEGKSLTRRTNIQPQEGLFFFTVSNQ